MKTATQKDVCSIQVLPMYIRTSPRVVAAGRCVPIQGVLLPDLRLLNTEACMWVFKLQAIVYTPSFQGVTKSGWFGLVELTIYRRRSA